MKKLLFILNPNAGTRKANRFLVDIISTFNQAGFQVDTYITSAPGDGTQVAAHRAKDVDLIVCCGGDGTFNEIVSGVLQSGATVPLGYIPAGSTNDFARSLQLSTNIMKATRQIVDGTDSQYDVGLWKNQHFAYVASFGAFTRASYATPQNLKNALGHTAYLLESVSELPQLKSIDVTLDIDGDVIKGPFLFGAICNSTSVGGILKLKPSMVDLCDGKFEVLLVRAPNDLAELNECIWALTKQTYDCKMITFRTAEKIRIHADNPIDWTLDGEKAHQEDSIEIRNLHRAITIRK